MGCDLMGVKFALEKFSSEPRFKLGSQLCAQVRFKLRLPDESLDQVRKYLLCFPLYPPDQHLWYLPVWRETPLLVLRQIRFFYKLV